MPAVRETPKTLGRRTAQTFHSSAWCVSALKSSSAHRTLRREMKGVGVTSQLSTLSFYPSTPGAVGCISKLSWVSIETGECFGLSIFKAYMITILRNQAFLRIVRIFLRSFWKILLLCSRWTVRMCISATKMSTMIIYSICILMKRFTAVTAKPPVPSAICQLLTAWRWCQRWNNSNTISRWFQWRTRHKTTQSRQEMTAGPFYSHSYHHCRVWQTPQRLKTIGKTLRFQLLSSCDINKQANSWSEATGRLTDQYSTASSWVPLSFQTGSTAR